MAGRSWTGRLDYATLVILPTFTGVEIRVATFRTASATPGRSALRAIVANSAACPTDGLPPPVRSMSPTFDACSFRLDDGPCATTLLDHVPRAPLRDPMRRTRKRMLSQRSHIFAPILLQSRNQDAVLAVLAVLAVVAWLPLEPERAETGERVKMVAYQLR